MIKVSYCVAYDWKMLVHSITQIYKQADISCLSLDQNRRSWSGSPFSWDEEGFKMLVTQLDVDNKIVIYEDSFYDPQLLPMQNEVAQRNKIVKYLGIDGWHIQLDADEYFIDFESFVNYLNGLRISRKVNVCCPLINLYKELPEGMLWIKPSKFNEIEYVPIASRYPSYEYGRKNGYFNILTTYSILHQSWARGEIEIWEKLNNWGHAKDFNVDLYYKQWKEVNSTNYKKYKNFHHLHPKNWPSLGLTEFKGNIDDLLSLSKENFPLPITNWDLVKANSVWLSRARKVIRKVLK